MFNTSPEFQSDDWSDSDEADAAAPPQDLITATRRIKILESNLAKAKQDLADYRKFVSERLDIPRLAETISPSLPVDPVPRDDDSHYFQSYGGNGVFSTLVLRSEPSTAPLLSRYTRSYASR